MAGPYPTNYGLAANGPLYTDPHPSQPLPTQPLFTQSDSASLSAAYPGPLPPPVQYPRKNRRPLFIGVALALVLAAALTGAIVWGAHQPQTTAEPTLSDATAKAVIQEYLVALENRDTDRIARNMLCGIYDAVRDRRSDQALAKLSSDAFRKQFAQAEVSSIDKIVYLSSYQTQVLFTMQVKPAGSGPSRQQVQGLAQLLLQRDKVFVCSYILRTAGAY